MKLLDYEFERDELYDDHYTRIISEFKEYEDVNLEGMLKEIIKDYSDPNNIINICTVDELKVLERILNDSIDDEYDEDIDKCIINLMCKLIIDDDFEIYDEFLGSVKKALKIVNFEKKDKVDELAKWIVSLVRVYAEIPIDVIKQFMCGTYEISLDDVSKALDSKIVSYYCIKIKDDEQFGETLLYHDYFKYFEPYQDALEKYRIEYNHFFTKKELSNIFKYGYDVDIPEVKEMVDLKDDSFFGPIIDDLLNYTLLTNDLSLLKKMIKEFYREDSGKVFNSYKKALNYTYHPCMCGNTPIARDYYLKCRKKFKSVVQNDARVTYEENRLFNKLLLPLLEYTNKKFKINPKVKKIVNNKKILLNEVLPIENKFWSDASNIIDDYIKDSNGKFTEEELKGLEDFKTARTGIYYLVRYAEDASEFMAEDGTIYMVKSTNVNLSKLIPEDLLPLQIKITILMFNGRLIHSSIFEPLLNFDDSFLKTVSEYDNSFKYYHF